MSIYISELSTQQHSLYNNTIKLQIVAVSLFLSWTGNLLVAALEKEPVLLIQQNQLLNKEALLTWLQEMFR